MHTADQSSTQFLGTEYAAELLLFSHEFPSDDVQELFRSLHRHSKGRKFALLAAFLTECDHILEEEIARLPKQVQDQLPPFQTVTRLASNFDALRKGPLGGAWEGAFLCIYQIAMLLGHFESYDVDYSLSTRNATAVGMSIGLFAAAATVAASSISDLAYTGAEAVRVSFTFCAHVGRTSDLLETRGVDEGLPSWAYVVTGLSADEIQKELDFYNDETSTSSLNKLSISHTDQNSVGITGPPARLTHLFRYSEVLRYSKHSSLQIHGGLCHVPNVYDSKDLDAILETLNIESWRTRQLRIPLLSPHTGLPFPANDAAHLIELIIQEALIKPLHFDNLTTGIANKLSSPSLSEAEILHFRTSIVSKELLTTLETNLSGIKIKSHDLVDWIAKEYVNPPRLIKDSKLAVVGMACRIPGGANDPELFWKLVSEGRDVHTKVPADRFDLEAHFDPTGKLENSTDTPYGNFIDNPGFFDSGFFNMSPREAEQTDPMQRLALVTAYEALELSGFVPNRTPSSNSKRVGTFYGQASDDYREVNANQNVSTYGIPGTERAFGNGRINYYFGFGGPSFNLDTACSSGLAAVHAACSSLWAGDSDLVIAGGINVITNPDIYCMLTKGHFLSKTGQCKVWDENADGYCRSDGIGSVVIKRLEDAVADNDKILATIVAGATNHSCDAVSITHPHVGAQKDNYKQVLLQAGVNPLDVSHVELHGTGTQAGDAVESQSVLETFAPLTPQRRPDQRLYLGAVKSNIGHGEAAAGVASLIKTLLMFQKNQIPRHVGIKTSINPVVAKHLDKRNACLVFETTPWVKPPGKKRYAIVNSFGAHGGNTTLLLEDAPEKSATGVVANEHLRSHLISISAKSKTSLKGNIENVLDYIDQSTLDQKNLLGDLSYTLVARRIHYPRRVATSVSSLSQLRDFLKASIEAFGDVRPLNPSATPAVVFAFTGQGALYEGAGLQLFQNFPAFGKQVRLLDRIAQQLGFRSILPVIEGGAVASENLADSPIVAQLSILILQISLTKFWQLLGIKPDVVIGHSLGEYAALVAAGVLSPADAIYLVGKRAELLQNFCKPNTHGMLSVRASAAEISRVVRNQIFYEVSCLNAADETVISGLKEDMNAIRTLLQAERIKSLVLDLPYAFHSGQLDPILHAYEKLATHVSFKQPSIPIVSPLLGKVIFDSKTINAKYLSRASRDPVGFVAGLNAAAAASIINEKTVWLEIGPHPVSSSFARSHTPDIKTFPSFRRGEDNFTTIPATLATLHILGLTIRWEEYYRPYEHSFNLLHLKHYHWNANNYFIPYLGTWTLDKAYPEKRDASKKRLFAPSVSSLATSSVQRVTVEEIQKSTGHLTAVTDIKRHDFLDAVKGHLINGQAVVTGSIWADMALTVGEHLYRRLVPSAKDVHVNVADMEVLESQKPDQSSEGPQLIQIEGDIDLTAGSTAIAWYALNADGTRSQHAFASATLIYEDLHAWQKEWRRTKYLVTGRISTLSSLATSGVASKLSRNMVYRLFQNVVDYADRYRGMQSAVLYGLEAFADIELVADRHGSWHTPPHWIDSVFQMAGFVMNGSDETSTQDFFYITPGWADLRIAKPLEAGTPYQSYVRMFPSEEEPNTWVGDIYALQAGEVVGVCGGIKFRKIPRILMARLFSAKEATPQYVHPVGEPKPARRAQLKRPPAGVHVTASSTPSPADVAPEPTAELSSSSSTPASSSVEAASKESSGNDTDKPPLEIVTNVLNLIARETGLPVKEFVDDASFAELGIDSLMSLVLSEKLLKELGVEVKSSIFLECPTVSEFTEWLTQYR